jgi:hypothetical protein
MIARLRAEHTVQIPSAIQGGTVLEHRRLVRLDIAVG